MSRTRAAAAASALLLATLGLAGCGDDSSSGPEAGPSDTVSDTTTTTTPAADSSSPAADPTGATTTSSADPNTEAADPNTKVIAITVEGDTIDPSGDEVDVKVGQPINLQVTADAPGEIHVHSNPEQEFEYDAGTTTLQMDPVEIPSQVVIESHTLDKVIVTLQVQP